MSEHKTISGKVAIVAMIVVAIGLTSFAWWYRYQQGRRAMAFWGPEAAQLIRHAPQVELADLSTVPTLDLPWRLEQGDLTGLGKRVYSDTPGLVHARHSLIVDANFQWDQRFDSPSTIVWDIAWCFIDDNREAVVLLDYETGAVKRQGDPRIAVLHPAIVRGMRDYIARHTGKSHSP